MLFYKEERKQDISEPPMKETGLPGGPVGKSLTCNSGGTGLIHGQGRSHRPWGS